MGDWARVIAPPLQGKNTHQAANHPVRKLLWDLSPQTASRLLKLPPSLTRCYYAAPLLYFTPFLMLKLLNTTISCQSLHKFFFSLFLLPSPVPHGEDTGVLKKKRKMGDCVFFVCVWWRTWDGGKVDDWGVKRLVWEWQQNHSSLLIFYWSLCSCFEYQSSLLTCSLWCLLLMRNVEDVPFLCLHRLFPPLLVTPANGKWIENNYKA